MRFLSGFVPFGQHGPRSAKAESELPEQTLALPSSQPNPVLLLNPGRPCLAVPQINLHARIGRLAAQRAIDLLQLLRIQTAGAAGTFRFL